MFNYIVSLLNNLERIFCFYALRRIAPVPTKPITIPEIHTRVFKLSRSLFMLMLFCMILIFNLDWMIIGWMVTLIHLVICDFRNLYLLSKHGLKNQRAEGRSTL